jgi:hypothetical protein
VKGQSDQPPEFHNIRPGRESQARTKVFAREVGAQVKGAKVVLLAQVAAHGAQVVPQEICQLHFLLFGEVLWPLEQQPPRLGQDGARGPGP